MRLPASQSVALTHHTKRVWTKKSRSVSRLNAWTHDDEMESEYPTKTYDNSSSDAEEEGPEDENIDDSVVDDDHDGKMQVDALLDFDANFSDASFSKSCCDQWHHPEHMKRCGNIGAASLIQSRLSHPKARIHICKIHSRLPCCCSSCGSLALATVVCSLSYFWGDKFGLFFA